MASKFRSLLSRAAGFLKQRFGSPRPAAKPFRGATGGHRGMAAGSIASRMPPLDEKKRPQYEKIKKPFTAEEMAKWGNIGPEEAEGFLWDGEILFVNSSNVAAAQFHRDAKKLMLEFKNGSAYLYSNVSPDEAQSFIQATSKGGWVWTDLRIRGSKTGHKKPYLRIR